MKNDCEVQGIMDPKLEVLDPNPDIYELFQKFDRMFFWGKLKCVEVAWSKQMTSCAGICYFSPREYHCRIRLSAPLLSLRPRTDYVNTLLHEMIHAFLFITFNNTDRTGHGPEFHSHMNRINSRAGTNITVYHTFIAEVKFYQNHVWRCNGPCRSQAPFYGLVRRATNRAPGKTDRWWSAHQAKCNGIFEKIEEPENYKKKKKQSDDGKSKFKAGNKETGGSIPDIRKFFNPNDASSNTPKANNSGSNSKITTFNDLPKSNGETIRSGGPSRSNIHTLGDSKAMSNGGHNMLKNKGSATFVVTGKPKTNYDRDTKPSVPHILNKPTTTTKSSQVDVRDQVRNVWANRFPEPPKAKVEAKPGTSGKRKLDDREVATVCDNCDEIVFKEGHKCKKASYPCPVCEKEVPDGGLEEHLSLCLGESINESTEIFDDIEEVSEEKNEENQVVACPICSQKISTDSLNSHIDECLNLAFIKEEAF